MSHECDTFAGNKHSMDSHQIESFSVIGISIRTTNENGQSIRDIPALWNKFMTEDISKKITNRIDDTIYSVYTEYEKDHTLPYTTILGFRVDHVDSIPDGLVAITIRKGKYVKYVAEGDLSNGIVYDTWMKIWNSTIKRAYTSDFEVYGQRAQDPSNAEVEIFISIIE
jgi:predicted transcriptional regulator YdeE